MRLYYAPQAAAEVDEILTYIAARSPQGARRVGACIRAAEQTLIEYPHVGQLTNARQPAVRRLVLRPFPYVVFYEASNDAIVIIGVRHAARDPASMPGRES